MRKIYVEELSQESRVLFITLAMEQNYSKTDIKNGLDSKILDLEEAEDELGFRHCEHAECRELFQEGFLTEDDTTFCSEMCAEETYPNLEEEDYGDFIFFTEW